MVWAARRVRHHAAYLLRHLLRQPEVDVVEHLHVRLVHHRVVAVTQLEGDGGDDVRLLVLRKRVVEKLRMVVVFVEFLPAVPLFDAIDLLRIATRDQPPRSISYP